MHSFSPARYGLSATLCISALLLLHGCYSSFERGEGGVLDAALDDGATMDASMLDGGARDAASLDAASLDAASIDASAFDAGPMPLDGALPDASLRDAGARIDAGRDAGAALDAGRMDAGTRDAGPEMDAGRRDSGPQDAARPDAARPDAAQPDAARVDAGPPSRALRFAPDDFLFAPHRPGLSTIPPITHEMWIRARGPGFASRKGSDSGEQHLVVRIDGSGDTAEIVTGWRTETLLTRELRAPFGAHMGSWTHVAVVIAASASGRLTITLYVDLELSARAEFPDDLGLAFNTQSLVMGRFDGDIDEVRIWASARSLATLRATALVRIPSGTPGMAAYWPLEESGQIALDRAMRGNDAILGRLTTVDDADPRWILDGPIP